nr:transposase [Streptacidiphilus rugosus]
MPPSPRARPPVSCSPTPRTCVRTSSCCATSSPGLSADDCPGKRGDGLRRPADPGPGQRRRPDWLDRTGQGSGSAVPARLRHGLERDRTGVDHALTLPWHNGRTEGVNNKIKLLKRQTYGRAGHRLLRQRILLS